MQAALRLRTVTAALVLAAALALSGGGSPVLAKCNPGEGNNYPTTYMDGWYSFEQSPTGGVYSNILDYSPWVTAGSDVSGWSMLDIRNGSTWAQIGWYEVAYGTRYTFTQWMTCAGCSPNTDFWNPWGTNQYIQYKVLWNNYCSSCLSFYAGGSLYLFQYAQWTPNEGEIFGETKSYSDQMPGAQQYHEDFSNSWLYQGGWREFGGTLGRTNNDPRFGYNYNGNSDFQIWDNRCTGT